MGAAGVPEIAAGPVSCEMFVVVIIDAGGGGGGGGDSGGGGCWDFVVVDEALSILIDFSTEWLLLLFVFDVVVVVVLFTLHCGVEFNDFS